MRDRGFGTGQVGCWVHDSHLERVQRAAEGAHYATVVVMGDDPTPFNYAVPVAKKEGRNHVQPADVVRHINRQTGKVVGVFYDGNYKAERLFALQLNDDEHAIIVAAGGIEVLGKQMVPHPWQAPASEETFLFTGPTGIVSARALGGPVIAGQLRVPIPVALYQKQKSY